jgi:hypothetical protein
VGTHLDPCNFYGRVFLPAVKTAKLEEVTWHTLRHTYPSRLSMNGHGDSTIAALLRHTGTTLVQRYAHLSPTHLKSAVEGVSGLGETPEKKGPIQMTKKGVWRKNSSGTVTETGNEAVSREKVA